MILHHLKAAFELANEVPIITPESVASVDTWERANGIKLPGALREWYSITNALEVLRRYSNEDHPQPLDKVERVCRVLDRETTRSATPQVLVVVPEDMEEGQAEVLEVLDVSPFVELIRENQDVVRWHVMLEGEDPPVYVDNDTRELSQWKRVKNLSLFLFAWFCGHRYNTDWGPGQTRAVTAEARLPDDAELAVLGQALSLGPRTDSAWLHQFYNAESCLQIGRFQSEFTSRLEPYWKILAASEDALSRILKIVWPLSNFADKARLFHLEDPATERVLTSMGWIEDKGVRDARWHLEQGMILRKRAQLAGHDPTLLRQAVVELSRAIELQPTLCVAYQQRVYANEKLGDYETVYADQMKLSALVPPNKSEITLDGTFWRGEAASTLQKLDRLDDAADAICELIREYPDFDYSLTADRFSDNEREDLRERIYICWREGAPKSWYHVDKIKAYFG